MPSLAVHFFVPFRQARDARHFGRYGPERQSCSKTVACALLVFLVTSLSCCVPFDCRQALSPGFMQFLDKAVRCPFMHRQVLWSRQCRSLCSRSSWTRLWTCSLSACQALVVTLPKTVAVSQLQFCVFCDRCVVQDGVRHRLELPQLQFIFKVVDFPVVAMRLPSCFVHGGRYPCCTDAAGRFALGIWTLFHGPGSGSHLFGTRCLTSTKIQIFLEMTSRKTFPYSSYALVDSGYKSMRQSTVAPGINVHISYVPVDSRP